MAGEVSLQCTLNRPYLPAAATQQLVYLFIEAMADGGVRMGLPRDVAVMLAAQTLLGAARMVLSGGMHPAELKDRVVTPGGTTAAGLLVLEERGVKAALIRAVEAATLRSRELTKAKLT